MKMLKATTAAAALAVGMTGAATAQQYVSGSAGFNFQTDSDNSGAFSRDFVTGDGVAVAPGTVLAEGTSVGWTTEFDTGLFLSAAYGWRLNEMFRVEGEISYTSADVDTHTGVTAGGAALGAADAAVLITGSAPLGVTVADLVADGQGEVTTVGYAINGYYDFPVQDTPFTAYIGGGLGIAEVEVDYSPSATPIVSDKEMVGFYQIMAGGSYAVSETTELYTGYRWRQSGDAETASSLIPASLDVENASHIIEAGVRYSF
jgi:opacity protein-like surface antigen